MNKPFGTHILEIGVNVMVPFIVLFGCYVVTHGHYGPGGGFQGGAIFAVAYMTLRLVKGRLSPLIIPIPMLLVIAGAGVGIFYLVGIVATFLGGLQGQFLDYALIFGKNEKRALGSLLVEVGVTITVASVLSLIYELLAISTKERFAEK